MTQNDDKDKRAKMPFNKKQVPGRANKTKRNITGYYTEVNPNLTLNFPGVNEIYEKKIIRKQCM